jgi:outer membrane immunogenic protein
MKKLLGSVALSALLAGSAMAADIQAKPVLPPASSVAPWTGVYAGAHVGGGWANFDSTIVPNSAVTPTQNLGGVDAGGWLAGGHVGVNRQFGNLVVGGELSASVSDISGSSGCTVSTVASTCKSSMDWLVMGLGRIGWANSSWLIYAQGGAAIAGFTSEYSNTGSAPVGNRRGTTSTIGGAAGAGVEYMVAPGVVAGVDYLHLFFNDTKTIFVDDVFDSLNTRLHDADIVRGRISLLWGGSTPALGSSSTPPVLMAAAPWTGAYAGLHAGGGWANFGNILVFDSPVTPAQDLGSVDAGGWLAGGHVGLNRQFGNLVVGGELSASASKIDGSSACAPETVASTCKTSMDWLVMALGRFGWTSNNWLLYAQGGAAIAGFSSGWDNTINAPTGFYRGTATTIGGAAGVGFEYMVVPGIVAGVDYVHLFFRDSKTVAVDDVFESLNTKLHDADIVRGRISWLWGGR